MSSNIKIATTTFSILSGLTIIAGVALVGSSAHADQVCTTTNGVVTCSNYGTPPVTVVNSATASVNVVSACTLSATGTTHSGTLTPGQFTGNIGGFSQVTAVCNNAGGYAIYAVGFSGDTATGASHTQLIHNVSSSNNIDTGTGTSGSSNWSMKLAGGTGDAASIVSPYNDYAAVPASYAKVASYTSATTGTSGTSFTTTYGAYINSTQAAGTYTGKVKYTMVTPATASAPDA